MPDAGVPMMAKPYRRVRRLPASPRARPSSRSASPPICRRTASNRQTGCVSRRRSGARGTSGSSRAWRCSGRQHRGRRAMPPSIRSTDRRGASSGMWRARSARTTMLGAHCGVERHGRREHPVDGTALIPARRRAPAPSWLGFELGSAATAPALLDSAGVSALWSWGRSQGRRAASRLPSLRYRAPF
jgi:hypothetical protein